MLASVEHVNAVQSQCMEQLAQANEQVAQLQQVASTVNQSMQLAEQSLDNQFEQSQQLLHSSSSLMQAPVALPATSKESNEALQKELKRLKRELKEVQTHAARSDTELALVKQQLESKEKQQLESRERHLEAVAQPALSSGGASPRQLLQSQVQDLSAELAQAERQLKATQQELTLAQQQSTALPASASASACTSDEGPSSPLLTFDLCDSSHDGVITREEWQAAQDIAQLKQLVEQRDAEALKQAAAAEAVSDQPQCSRSELARIQVHMDTQAALKGQLTAANCELSNAQTQLVALLPVQMEVEKLRAVQQQALADATECAALRTGVAALRKQLVQAQIDGEETVLLKAQVECLKTELIRAQAQLVRDSGLKVELESIKGDNTIRESATQVATSSVSTFSPDSLHTQLCCSPRLFLQSGPHSPHSPFVVQAKNEVLEKQLHSQTVEAAALETHLQSTRAELAAAQIQQLKSAALEQQSEELKEQLSQARAQLASSLQSQVEGLASQSGNFAELRAYESVRQHQINELKLQLVTTQEDLQEAVPRSTMDDLRHHLSQAQGSEMALKDSVSTLTWQLKDTRTQLSDQASLCERLKRDLAHANARIKQTEIHTAKPAVTTKEFDRVREELAAARTALAEVQDSALQIQATQCPQEADQAGCTDSELRSELQRLEGLLAQAQLQNSILSAECDEAQAQLAEVCLLFHESNVERKPEKQKGRMKAVSPKLSPGKHKGASGGVKARLGNAKDKLKGVAEKQKHKFVVHSDDQCAAGAAQKLRAVRVGLDRVLEGDEGGRPEHDAAAGAAAWSWIEAALSDMNKKFGAGAAVPLDVLEAQLVESRQTLEPLHVNTAGAIGETNKKPSKQQVELTHSAA